MFCEWCESNSAKETTKTGYWELPDGSRAIEINDIPSVSCEGCGMEYQPDTIIDQIEDQLMLIDTKSLSQTITFNELMNQPRLLKKNYFKFD
ncbi:YokU family protein [Fictibacillus sp. Mic-4]|uniref:YokU family protein n=1 Tax=Fictibacillus TaxID=1329200 RepID=UPI0004142821|nr:YokU family protein [Fictibacillus gelatini]